MRKLNLKKDEKESSLSKVKVPHLGPRPRSGKPKVTISGKKCSSRKK